MEHPILLPPKSYDLQKVYACNIRHLFQYDQQRIRQLRTVYDLCRRNNFNLYNFVVVEFSYVVSIPIGSRER